ncbi:MAG TPA: methyltransferase domain-containing protein [bacterium]|nr:methyltransferase domain-containing protein [bacterium]
MELVEAIKSRRSIRKFKDQPVPKAEIEKMLDAARWAPSACNRQLWEFVVIRRKDIRERIAREACFGQKFLLGAPVIIAVFYDDTKERQDEDHPAKHDSIQSASAAIQNMILTAHSLGLGSIWAGSIRHMMKLNKILHVPSSIRPVAIVAVGYPAETPKPPYRRPFQSFVHYDQYRQGPATYPNSPDPEDWSLEALSAYRAQVCWFGGNISPDFILERVGFQGRTYSTLMEYAERLWPVSGRVLDVLPYAGGFLAGLLKIAKNPKQITAFELSEGNVEFIRENLDGFSLPEPLFAVGTDTELKLPNGPYSFITCFFRTEKMPEPLHLLNEMHRVLDSSGTLILAAELKGLTGIPRMLPGKHKTLHTSKWWNTGAVKPRSKRVILSWIRSAGFEITESRVLRSHGLVKSLARQLFRIQGDTLILVLKK